MKSNKAGKSQPITKTNAHSRTVKPGQAGKQNGHKLLPQVPPSLVSHLQEAAKELKKPIEEVFITSIVHGVVEMKLEHRRENGPKETAEEFAARYKAKQDKENAELLNRLHEISGIEPHWILREVLQVALPKVLPNYKKKQMFNHMACVMDAKNGDERRALGFVDGKLVTCDGKKYTPISLLDSVRWYSRTDAWWDDMDFDFDAKHKWLRMVAKAVPA